MRYGRVSKWDLDSVRRVIRESNARSAEGTQKYVVWENRAIRTDYEFIACTYDRQCWCQRNGCTGHYRLKPITFHQFLETYVTLWIPPKARENVKAAVLEGRSFQGRQRNAIKPLRWLNSNWADVFKGVKTHNSCGLCGPSTRDCRGSLAQRQGETLLLLRDGRRRSTQGEVHFPWGHHPHFWRRLLAQRKAYI